MKRKRNVLIIENSIDVTGALKSIVQTCLNNSSEFNYVFLLPRNSKASVWLKLIDFNNIVFLPMVELSRNAKGNLRYLPCLVRNAIALKRIIKLHKIDLVVNNDLYNLLPIGSRLLGSRIPYVCFVRFLPNRFPKLLFSFWIRVHLHYAFSIIAVSHYLANRLPNSRKVRVIYNELPLELSHIGTEETLIEREKVFLYLSNFIDGKGQNYALEAFAMIEKDLPEWKLRFIGGDMGLVKNKAYFNQLRVQSENLKIANKCEWLGFTNNVQTEYKRVEISLNFSESESFSLTCLESIYFGTPVISTKSGGPEEIVAHRETGILVENRNIQEMADAMLMLANNDDLRKKANEIGSALVREKFSPDKTSGKLFAIFAEALRK